LGGGNSLDAGDYDVARAVANYAMAELVGQKNYGCRTTPVTEPMYLDVNSDKLSAMLYNSRYSVAKTEMRDTAEWVAIQVSPFTSGC
jgi:hypothetical protein